jgi:hypothetical protein
LKIRLGALSSTVETWKRIALEPMSIAASFIIRFKFKVLVFYFRHILFFFAALIQKDRGTGPEDVLASYSEIEFGMLC